MTRPNEGLTPAEEVAGRFRYIFVIQKYRERDVLGSDLFPRILRARFPDGSSVCTIAIFNARVLSDMYKYFTFKYYWKVRALGR